MKSLLAGEDRCAESSLVSCSSVVGNLAVRDAFGSSASRDTDVRLDR